MKKKLPSVARLFAVGVSIALLAASCSDGDDSPSEAAATTTVVSAPGDSSTASTTTIQADPDSEEGSGPAAGGFPAVTEAVQSFVDDRGLNGAGLIVVHRDQGVLYHEHFGEFDEDRVSLIASSSKMISAGVLLKLQEQGLVDIDAPVSDVVSWGARNPDVTPAQLVSNSSGLVGLFPDLFFSPYICQWDPASVLGDCGEAIFTTDADDDQVIPLTPSFGTGERNGRWREPLPRQHRANRGTS